MNQQPPPENPYAPTNTSTWEAGFDPLAGDDEAIRRKYLSHEASVKSIGSLYILGSIFTVLGGGAVGIGLVAGLASGDLGAFEGLLLAIASALYFTVSAVHLFAAWGLRKLAPWGRVMGIVLSSIGLLAIPVGTFISAYFLFLLLSRKGRYVFTEEYRSIVADTPHLKYRTSIVVWVFLGLLLLALVLLVVGALAGVSV